MAAEAAQANTSAKKAAAGVLRESNSWYCSRRQDALAVCGSSVGSSPYMNNVAMLATLRFEHALASLEESFAMAAAGF